MQSVVGSAPRAGAPGVGLNVAARKQIVHDASVCQLSVGTGAR